MGEPIRICHITSIRSCFDNRIFAKECLALAAAGYDVHVIGPGGPGKKIGGIELHASPLMEGTFFRRLKQTPLVYYPLAVKVQAHIYHLHDPELLRLGTMLKKAGRIVIYDVRENVSQEIRSDASLPFWYRAPAAYWFELLENRSAKKFDLVIGADQYIRDRFHHVGCVAIDVNDYPSSDELQVLKVDFAKKERAVCYIGDLSEECGLFDMLEAVNKINCKLLLVGKFLAASDRDRALKHPGWRLVEEYDGTSREQTNNVLERALAGLVVFHRRSQFMEAEPRQCAEYMLAKIPVIGSSFRMWESLIEGGQCGLCVEPENPDFLADKISYFINNREEAKRMGENGSRTAREKYNWEKEKRKLLSSYRQLLSEYGL